METLRVGINLINDNIRRLNMEIQKVFSEDDGASNYVLVGFIDTSFPHSPIAGWFFYTIGFHRFLESPMIC